MSVPFTKSSTDIGEETFHHQTAYQRLSTSRSERIPADLCAYKIGASESNNTGNGGR
jgi:hypothetical protein